MRRNSYRNSSMMREMHDATREAVGLQIRALMLLPYSLVGGLISVVMLVPTALVGALVLSQTVTRLDGAVKYLPNSLSYGAAFGLCMLVLIACWLVRSDKN